MMDDEADSRELIIAHEHAVRSGTKRARVGGEGEEGTMHAF